MNWHLVDGWLVVFGFNATFTAKVISWQSMTHMCFLVFSHPVLAQLLFPIAFGQMNKHV